MQAIEIIHLIGKEFVSVPDSVLEKYIEMVKPLVSRKQFGNLYQHGLAYLVCHKLKLAGYGESLLGDIGGAANTDYSISSVSEGGSSISFGTSQGGNLTPDAELGLTTYGAQYLQLRRYVIVPIHCSGESAWIDG